MAYLNVLEHKCNSKSLKTILFHWSAPGMLCTPEIVCNFFWKTHFTYGKMKKQRTNNYPKFQFMYLRPIPILIMKEFSLTEMYTFFPHSCKNISFRKTSLTFWLKRKGCNIEISSTYHAPEYAKPRCQNEIRS